MYQLKMWSCVPHQAAPSWKDSTYENVSLRGLTAGGLNIFTEDSSVHHQDVHLVSQRPN